MLVVKSKLVFLNPAKTNQVVFVTIYRSRIHDLKQHVIYHSCLIRDSANLFGDLASQVNVARLNL